MQIRGKTLTCREDNLKFIWSNLAHRNSPHYFTCIFVTWIEILIARFFYVVFFLWLACWQFKLLQVTTGFCSRLWFFENQFHSLRNHNKQTTVVYMQTTPALCSAAQYIYLLYRHYRHYRHYCSLQQSAAVCAVRPKICWCIGGGTPAVVQAGKEREVAKVW